MKVIDQRLTFAELVAEYNFSALEQAELGEYLTAVNAMLTTEIGNRTALGDSAERDGRGAVENVIRTALLQIEQGKMTLAEFRTQLGI